MPSNTSKPSTAAPASTARFEVVVVGVSAGGVALLQHLLPELPSALPLPVVICMHAAAGTTRELAELLARRCPLPVCEAHDQEALQPGHVYLAPGGYHLHLDSGPTACLSIDAPVKSARPSVDVLFDSAAHACRERVLAVVLSGASDDGAEGACRVKAAGGVVVVQDPEEAEARTMPEAALAAGAADHVVGAAQLPSLLLRLIHEGVCP